MKTYPLRSKQIWAYALLLPIFILCLLMLVSIPLMVFIDNSNDNFIFYLGLLSFFLLIILVITFYLSYQHLRQAYLTIDNKGIRISSKLLNMIPNFKSLKFHSGIQFYLVENYASSIAGGLAKFEQIHNDIAIIAVDTTYSLPKMTVVISNNVWEIEDVGELQAYLQQLGQTVQSIPAQDFINQYAPQFSDMGKKAGYVSYSAVAFVLITISILYLDPYATIYYGAFQYSIWIMTLLSAVGVLFFIKDNPKQLGGQIIVSLLFGLTFGLMLFMIALAIVPIIGSKYQVTFAYKGLNNYDEEEWLSVDAVNPSTNEEILLKIHCAKASDASHTVQTTTVYKMFSVIRVNGNTLCPDSKFLSDGTLPHE